MVNSRAHERQKLIERLAVVSQRHRAAFAVACAERLIPLYRWFQQVESWGDVTVLENGIELVWSWVLTNEVSHPEIAQAIHECEEVAPDTSNFRTSLASRALDAADAVGAALEACIKPEPETAAYAGEVAWECAFGIEQSRFPQIDDVRITDRELLREAARGGFVILEEDLQRRSLERLRQISLTGGEADLFRKVFSKLSE